MDELPLEKPLTDTQTQSASTDICLLETDPLESETSKGSAVITSTCFLGMKHELSMKEKH